MFKEKEIYTDKECGDTLEILSITHKQGWTREIKGAWIKLNNEPETWWNDGKIENFISDFC
tara:strand:- start:3071 stop:3253 length:183 start_codon:yes stop_codon:yes gene_type:complete